MHCTGCLRASRDCESERSRPSARHRPARENAADAPVFDDIRHHGPCTDPDASIDLGDISAQLSDPLHVDDDRGPFEAFFHTHQKIGASSKEARVLSVGLQHREQLVERFGTQI
jgi:hypothetical protein